MFLRGTALWSGVLRLREIILSYQREWHGDDTETEVRQGQVTDEDIPGGPHLGRPHDGDQDQEVTQTPN